MGLPVIVAAIGLMLLGGGAISLGAQGFSREGMPLGLGRRLSGRPARVVGVVLVWLGMGIFGTTALLLLSL